MKQEHPNARIAFVSCLASVTVALAVACSATPGRTPTGSTSSSVTTGAKTTSSSNSSSSSGAAGDDCDDLCATEAKLDCDGGTSTCVSTCEYLKTEITWCTTTGTAATDCLAKQPESSFSCVGGAALPKADICTTELAANQSCWYDGPTGGLPDLTSACTTVCQTKSGLSCADASCVSGCEAGVKAGVKCNGAFAALVACAAKLTASDFTCSGSPATANINAGLCTFEETILGECLNG